MCSIIKEQIVLGHNALHTNFSKLERLGDRALGVTIEECLTILPKHTYPNRIEKYKYHGEDSTACAVLTFYLYKNHDWDDKLPEDLLKNYAREVLKQLKKDHKYQLSESPPEDPQYVYWVSFAQWERIRRLVSPRVGDFQEYQAREYSLGLELKTSQMLSPRILALRDPPTTSRRSNLPARCGKRGPFLGNPKNYPQSKLRKSI